MLIRLDSNSDEGPENAASFEWQFQNCVRIVIRVRAHELAFERKDAVEATFLDPLVLRLAVSSGQTSGKR